ncbi:MAG: hypothetical protein FWE67_10595 [Planctomycetaceae bacterium]|nr:hypothetical protein [Planctomycetaceae bacterium]
MKCFYFFTVAALIFGLSGETPAQQYGTTTGWGNGTRTTFSDGSSAVTVPWGNGTRTTYTNSDGSSGGSATTSPWDSGKRTNYGNPNVNSNNFRRYGW